MTVVTATMDKLNDLLGKRDDLLAKVEPDPLEVIDAEIATAQAELEAEQAKANHKRLIELRRQEKQQMERVIAAADALWAEIEPLDDIWREQRQVSPSAAALAVIPRQLADLLRPGWHGERRHWAHVRNFANFDYT